MQRALVIVSVETTRGGPTRPLHCASAARARPIHAGAACRDAEKRNFPYLYHLGLELLGVGEKERHSVRICCVAGHAPRYGRSTRLTAAGADSAAESASGVLGDWIMT